MMVHLTKEKSEVSWGVRGVCFYTEKILSPKVFVSGISDPTL